MAGINSSFSNIFSNETSDNTVFNTKEYYFIAVITSVNVLVSAVCLLYILLKLTLNKYVKAILFVMAIQNIICSIVMTTLSAIIITNNDQSFWTSQCILATITVQFRTHSLMTPLISVLRYAMALKASNAKMIKKRHVIYAITMCTFSPYFNAALNVIMNGRNYFYLDIEVQNTHEYQLPIVLAIFNVPMSILLLSIGIFFDYKMFLFVKKRNQIEPIQLVPWKSVSAEEKENDMDVPVRSTIISTVFIVSFCIVFSIYMVLDHFWPIPIIVSLYCIIPIPLIILFSVKDSKSKEGKAQPPRGLHFHNDLPIDE